jgi:hypothetical protein
MNKFGENFNKSLAASRERQAAEEKELKLTAEKNAKEAKEQTLNNQVFQSKLEYNSQVSASAVGEKLKKVGATPSAMEMVNNWKINSSKVVGEYDYENATTVLTKEQREKASTYKVQQAQGEANLVDTTVTSAAQIQALKTFEINGTNMGEYRFNGATSTAQVLNRMTAFSLAYDDDLKTKKNLIYDVNKDPSQIKLTVDTKIGNIDELRKVYLETNPALKGNTDEETNKLIDIEIQEGIKNKDITQDGNDYTLNFRQDIGKGWDGTFYSKIPKTDIGTTPVKIGIYEKENDTEVSNTYMLPTEYVDSKGNANLTTAEGVAKYQRTPIDIKAIKLTMRPSLEAKAAGMIATDLSNPDVANGVLASLDFGTNYPAKEFAKLTTNEKVKLIADKLEEKEAANIISKSNLTKIGDVYYKMNPEDLKIFSEKASSKSGETKPKAFEVKWKRVSKDIWNQKPGVVNDFSFDGKKVRFDGKNFSIASGDNLGYEFKTKQEVVDYLNTGE